MDAKEQTLLITAGVDEAGRGPLAGPVIAAAVILDPNQPIEGLADSKTLSEQKREQLFIEVTHKCLAYAVGRAEVLEIEQLNILQATLLAMKRAVDLLVIKPEIILVDGLHKPQVVGRVQAIVKGDQLIPAISAASIVAKVTRDAEMCRLDVLYPGYGLAKHKGYGTKMHLEKIRELGPCELHRRTFAGVKEHLV